MLKESIFFKASKKQVLIYRLWHTSMSQRISSISQQNEFAWVTKLNSGATIVCDSLLVTDLSQYMLWAAGKSFEEKKKGRIFFR